MTVICPLRNSLQLRIPEFCRDSLTRRTTTIAMVSWAVQTEKKLKKELKDLKDNDNNEEVYGRDKVENKEAEEEIIGADEDVEEVKVGIKRPREKNEQIIDHR